MYSEGGAKNPFCIAKVKSSKSIVEPRLPRAHVLVAPTSRDAVDAPLRCFCTAVPSDKRNRDTGRLLHKTRQRSMSAMATIKINVKWGKENVPCEIKPGQTPDQLFDDLQNKTGVPVARQKLMARGAWRGVLKSGMAMDLKDGQNVTLMGTADVLLKPKVETKFLEDMKVGKQSRKRPST